MSRKTTILPVLATSLVAVAVACFLVPPKPGVTDGWVCSFPAHRHFDMMRISHHL
jgi:hypothetical protein